MTNRIATPGQLSAVGFKIAGTVTRVLGEGGFDFDQANQLILDDEQTLEKLTENFCKEIFGVTVDPWTEEKRRIERFYRKFFNREVDWAKISLPAKRGMNRLEVIFSEITEDEVFAAYAKKFGSNAVWKYYDSITSSIAEQQARPVGDYAFCHIGGDEADMLGKSYDDGITAGVKFMTPKEGIVAAFRHRVETSKMYDVKGLTRFSALASGGYAMGMFRFYDGQFHIGCGYRGYRNPDYGLRQVSF